MDGTIWAGSSTSPGPVLGCGSSPSFPFLIDLWFQTLPSSVPMKSFSFPQIAASPSLPLWGLCTLQIPYLSLTSFWSISLWTLWFILSVAFSHGVTFPSPLPSRGLSFLSTLQPILISRKGSSVGSRGFKPFPTSGWVKRDGASVSFPAIRATEIMGSLICCPCSSL